MFLLIVISVQVPPPPPLHPSLSQKNYIYKEQNLKSNKHEIKINYYHALQMFILWSIYSA